MADDRNKATDEKSDRSTAAVKKSFRPLQVVSVEQKIFSDPEHKRFAAIITHEVGEGRANHRSEAGYEDRTPEAPFAVGHQETDERHNRFAGDRHNHAFQGH